MLSFFSFSIFLTVFSFICPVWTQFVPPYDPSPFNVIGTIDSLTLDPTGGVLAGGSIVVDGVPYIVPQNLIATLPATAVAWGELFFKNGTANLPGNVSWEANVIGNRVNGQYICGLVYIAQRALQLLEGFITSIDLTTGHFRVGVGAGIECVLNDPTGRYGKPYLDHPLWQADPDNPSIHATSGFPVCIPRSQNDPLCPGKNRPNQNGKPVQTIQFGDPANLGPNDPDPRLMVPLAVGDYITFTGTRVGGGLLAIYFLNVNLGLFTAPNTKPVYVNCDAMNYAIRDATVPGAISETRADGWVSDISATVQWFAQDVDPCTGAVTERDLLLLQASPVAPVGRLQYRLGAFDVSPATRNVGFRASQGTMVTPNNLTAGEFIQPVFNYIFPELIVAGAPAFPNEFELMPYLAHGGGPYSPGTFGLAPPTTPVIIGQLKPWPGAFPPVTKSCPAVSANPASPAPSAPATAATGPRDVITIITVSKTATRGVTTVSVTALSSSLTAKLFLTIAGLTVSNPTPMTSLGSGLWKLSISSKIAVTTVTVTSNFGGSISGPA